MAFACSKRPFRDAETTDIGGLYVACYVVSRALLQCSGLEKKAGFGPFHTVVRSLLYAYAVRMRVSAAVICISCLLLFYNGMCCMVIFYDILFTSICGRQSVAMVGNDVYH